MSKVGSPRLHGANAPGEGNVGVDSKEEMWFEGGSLTPTDTLKGVGPTAEG